MKKKTKHRKQSIREIFDSAYIMAIERARKKYPNFDALRPRMAAIIKTDTNINWNNSTDNILSYVYWKSLVEKI